MQETHGQERLITIAWRRHFGCKTGSPPSVQPLKLHSNDTERERRGERQGGAEDRGGGGREREGERGEERLRGGVGRERGRGREGEREREREGRERGRREGVRWGGGGGGRLGCQNRDHREEETGITRWGSGGGGGERGG